MDSGRRPRLCHLIKNPDFDGFGFNLHAEKHKTGHYIGRIEEDSPAFHAGLLEGDRLIEVNGNSVVNYTHAQVVNAIKSVSNESKLLVVDPLTDQYFEEENIPISGSLRNILYLTSELPTENIVTESSAIPKPNSVSRSSSIRQSLAGIFTKNTTNQDSPVNQRRPSNKKLGSDLLPYANLVRCQLKTDKNFKGYGFDLHNQPTSLLASSPDSSNPTTQEVLILEDASKTPEDQTEEPIPFQGAHFIGTVEHGSPAEKAGVMTGDIVYQVNNRSARGLKHDEVVHLIRVDPEKSDIIVARIIGDNWNPVLSPPPSSPTTPSVVVKTNNSSPLTSFPYTLNTSTPTTGSHHRQAPSPNKFDLKKDLNASDNSANEISSPNPSKTANITGLTALGAGTAIAGASTLITSKKKKAADPIPDPPPRKVMEESSPSTANKDSSKSYAKKPDYPIVKLVHLRKWPDFNGYGFNLHAGKIENEIGPDGNERIGHFIGSVDPDSPASAVGLDEGDRIIEVDSKNVENMDHKSVVDLIRSDPDRTCMLLVAQKDYPYFHENHIPITARWGNLIEAYSNYPDGRPSRTGSINKSPDRKTLTCASCTGNATSTKDVLSAASPFLIGGMPLAVNTGNTGTGYHDKSDFKAYESNVKRQQQLDGQTPDQLSADRNRIKNFNDNNNDYYTGDRREHHHYPTTNKNISPDSGIVITNQSQTPPRGHEDEESQNKLPKEYINVAAERTPDWERGKGHVDNYSNRSPPNARYSSDRYYGGNNRYNSNSPSSNLGAMNARDGVKRYPIGSPQDYGAGRFIGQGNHDVTGVHRNSTGSPRDYSAGKEGISSGNHAVNQKSLSKDETSQTSDEQPSLSAQLIKASRDNSEISSSYNTTKSTTGAAITDPENNPSFGKQEKLMDRSLDSKLGQPSYDAINSASNFSTQNTFSNQSSSSKLMSGNDSYTSRDKNQTTDNNLNNSTPDQLNEANNLSNTGSKDVWNMSATEYKARLDNERRKRDMPKFDSRTLKEKYEILQQM